MKIREITCPSEIDSLMSIVATHAGSGEDMDESRTQLIKELNECGDNRHIFIAESGKEPIAMIQIILKNADNDPKLANGKEIAHMHNLQVRADHQGLGIGTRMIAFAENKAREMKKEILTLGVDGDNDRAIRLYKHLNYEIFAKEEGRFPGEFGYSMKKML